MTPIRLKIALFTDQVGLNTIAPLLGDHLVAVVGSSLLFPSDRLPENVLLLQQQQTSESNHEELVRRLADLELDALICFSYSLKIPSSIISLPRLDAVNVHGGLLPECRGANVLNWVLIEDHRETGCTMHLLSDVIDNGDIVYRETIPISDNDDALSLRSKIATVAQSQIQRAITVWCRGEKLDRVPQNPQKARRYRRRTPEDGLFDWTFSDRQIFNLIRALVDPWPGAYFFQPNGTKHIINSFVTIEDVAQIRKQYSQF